MFTGYHELTADWLGRIRLPSSFREELKKEQFHKRGFHLVAGDKLCGYSDAVFDRLAQSLFKDRASAIRPQGDKSIRSKLMAMHQQMRYSPSGFVKLPRGMMERYGLRRNRRLRSRDICAVGYGDHFELWEKSQWLAYQETLK